MMRFLLWLSGPVLMVCGFLCKYPRRAFNWLRNTKLGNDIKKLGGERIVSYDKICNLLSKVSAAFLVGAYLTSRNLTDSFILLVLFSITFLCHLIFGKLSDIENEEKNDLDYSCIWRCRYCDYNSWTQAGQA
jgi:hypothetical protein